MERKKFHKKHMATVGDLFPEYAPYHHVRGQGNLCKKYGKKNKCRVARGVFHSFVNLVMDDIIEGHVFQMPSFKGMLYVEQVPAYALDKMRQGGMLQGFEDALVTRPCIPTYRFVSNNGSRHKFRVILDKQRYRQLLKNQSEGMRYSGNIGIW